MDWPERFASVRRWTRGGERAAHKPLLLLYALGHFQRSGDTPILFSEAGEHLRRLLRDFGPPRATSPAYPFHHLTSDGFWAVTTGSGGGSPGSSGVSLRNQQAAGHFVPDLARSLHQDPQLLTQLAHVVLDSNFEPSLHADICGEIGLDLEETGTAAPQRQRRDPEFPRSVLMAYEYRCAFCGYDGSLEGSAPGLEAAHVRWWTHGGPNDIANGICLCSIHHKLFDKGVLGITAEHRITVSARFVGRSQSSHQLVLSLCDRRASSPMKGFPAIAAHHAGWHAREVFRAPGRAG